MAGALGADAARAEDQVLVARLLPMPAEDQWVLVRAIAFSGLPEWKAVSAKFADRMPTRKVMIDDYLAGKLPTLNAIALEDPKPTFMETMKGYLTLKAFSEDRKAAAVAQHMTFDQNQELLDTLWGYYFASGAYAPILRILTLLPWAKEKDTIDKLTIGSMAEYTLATYAVRTSPCVIFSRAKSKHQPKPVAVVLNGVIEAADTVQTRGSAKPRSARWRNSSSRDRTANGICRSGAKSGSEPWRSDAWWQARWVKSSSAFPA